MNSTTHQRYGFTLTALPCMRLEEILAEKIARLSRKATARDASDLVWTSKTSPHSKFARERVRRLAILKVWVDNNGMQPSWPPALACKRFDPSLWLSPREQWDDEQIGMLASQPPTLRDLENALYERYSWLAQLTPEEERWTRADPRDRGTVLTAIRTLDGGALGDALLY